MVEESALVGVHVISDLAAFATRTRLEKVGLAIATIAALVHVALRGWLAELRKMRQ
jgi:hypothetical protein